MQDILAVVLVLAILIVISAVVTFAKNGLAILMLNAIKKILGMK